ncbi:MAG: urate hydroxylase PuuD [Bdellovibrionales bacterium]|nr:urate hydroxylase PuuD [Bdellovibrionales bacterium]
MNQEIFEWLQLLGRWLHIMVGITWIGTSIFFMWLDRSFVKNPESKNPGHIGDLWMVHGGGFYHVEKLLMGPTPVPKELHWFKWESYWTWMSGIFLLALIFYSGSGTFLLDSSVSKISFVEAILLSLGSLIGSWVFYDTLWESNFTKKNPLAGHTITLLWFGGMVYLLCHTLSGRAAYIHIGGMLGTWMTANVFLRIIPRQVKMVEASKRGEPVNQEWAKNAKNRSTHNTYFTLPVIFIMLSNHFPNTYGNAYNWQILIAISAAGAAIREFFVVRLSNPMRSRRFGVLGATIILAVMILTRENLSQEIPATPEPAVNSKAEESAPVDVGPHGTLRGRALYRGTPPARETLSVPGGCNPSGKPEVLSNDILVSEGKVANVLVSITRGLKPRDFGAPPKTHAVLDQKECQYEPRLLAVRVGQPVDFLNSDPIFHNVKSLSKENENFNVAMPLKNDKMTKVFQKPEIFIESKCSVHPWMSASIAVLDHPYFQVTGTSGEFTISNVPVGTYTLEAWHEVFGSLKQEVTVKADQTLELDFSYGK